MSYDRLLFSATRSAETLPASETDVSFQSLQPTGFHENPSDTQLLGLRLSPFRSLDHPRAETRAGCPVMLEGRERRFQP